MQIWKIINSGFREAGKLINKFNFLFRALKVIVKRKQEASTQISWHLSRKNDCTWNKEQCRPKYLRWLFPPSQQEHLEWPQHLLLPTISQAKCQQFHREITRSPRLHKERTKEAGRPRKHKDRQQAYDSKRLQGAQENDTRKLVW